MRFVVGIELLMLKKRITVPSCFFVHRFSIRAVALLARQLTQQLSYNLRALVCLLLDLAFADRVEGAKEPHFLQVADEHLQVFSGFDLRRLSKYSKRRFSRSSGTCRLTRCDVSTCIWNWRLAVMLRSVLSTYSSIN